MGLQVGDTVASIQTALGVVENLEAPGCREQREEELRTLVPPGGPGPLGVLGILS